MQDAVPMIDQNAEAAEARVLSASADAPRPVEIEPEETDEALMAAFATGRAEAFTALFKRYWQPVFGFFRRRVGDAAQAEEMAQETFIAVLRAAARYEVSAAFRTWLYAIAFKILRSWRRKTAFRATFLGEKPAEWEPAMQSTQDVEVLMRSAVSKLDAVDREVLMLREFEQLSYAEIAELLQLPLNTVRSRLFRARTALHELLMAKAQKEERV